MTPAQNHGKTAQNHDDGGRSDNGSYDACNLGNYNSHGYDNCMNGEFTVDTVAERLRSIQEALFSEMAALQNVLGFWARGDLIGKTREGGFRHRIFSYKRDGKLTKFISADRFNDRIDSTGTNAGLNVGLNTGLNSTAKHWIILQY